MVRVSALRCVLLLLGLLGLAACDSGTPVAPTAVTLPTAAATATGAPAGATSTPATTAASTATIPPSPTPQSAIRNPQSPTADAAAAAVYATITALARDAAATATAASAPPASPTAVAAVPVPADKLGTYRLIVTGRAEDQRVYQAAGRLVLSAAKPDSGHSAEVLITVLVRAGQEFADLAPGTKVGGLVLASRADLLPAGFDKAAAYATRLVYDPDTKLLTLTADPNAGLPGGWSLGPQNKTGKPRPITAGQITFTFDRPNFTSIGFDLQSVSAGGPPAAYTGGMQGQK